MFEELIRERSEEVVGTESNRSIRQLIRFASKLNRPPTVGEVGGWCCLGVLLFGVGVIRGCCSGVLLFGEDE